MGCGHFDPTRVMSAEWEAEEFTIRTSVLEAAGLGLKCVQEQEMLDDDAMPAGLLGVSPSEDRGRICAARVQRMRGGGRDDH